MIQTSINRRVERLIEKGTLSSSSGLHLDCMDGLRGVAILMVVACHTIYANPNGPALFLFIYNLVGSGRLGVPVFFVLSGFLISYPFFQARLKDPQFWFPRGYAVRRALKIFPPFYLAITLFALLAWLRFHDPAYLRTGMQWATGIAHYVNPPRDLNGAFWSLWVELHFYFVLPFLFLLFRGAGLRSTYWGLFFVFALVPPLVRALSWPVAAEPEELVLFVRRFPNALDNFAWGILLAGIFISGSSRAGSRTSLARFGYAGTLLLVVSAVVLAFAKIPFRVMTEWERILPGVAAFLMGFFIFDPRALGTRILCAPVLRFIGIVSFEWFLIHQPFLAIARQLAGSAEGSFWRYFLIISLPNILSFLLAVLIYYKFSLPIMRRGRDWLSARKKNAVSVTPRVPGVETKIQ